MPWALLALVVALLFPQTASAQTAEVVVGETIAIERNPPQQLTVAVAVPGAPAGVTPRTSLLPDGADANISVAALDEPPTVVMTIDRSGSMAGRRLELAKSAAAQCLERLPLDASLALVAFDDEVEVVEEFTVDRDLIVTAIEQIDAGGDTATFDAVIAGTELVEFSRTDSLSERASRFIVLLSDGEDTASVASAGEASQRLLDSGFRLYALGVDTEEGGLATLEGLVETTGGLALNGTAEELARSCSSVAARIDGRLQVSLTFADVVPSNFTIRLEFDDFVAEVPVVAPRSIGAPTVSNDAIKTGPLDLDMATGSAAVDVPTAPAAQTSLDQAALDVDPVLDEASPATVTPSQSSSGLANDNPWVPPKDADPRLLWLGAGLALAAPLVVIRSLAGRRPAHGLTIRRLPRARILERLTGSTHRLLERQERGRVLERKLELAAVSLRAGEFVVFTAFAALAVAAGLAMLGMRLSAVVGLIALPLVSVAWVNRRGKRRAARFEEQLGETIVILAGAIRSGSSSMQALGIAASKAPSPTAEEFQRVIAEARIGRDPVASLRDLADRMHSEDTRWLVEALALNRELGGNLARTLDGVGETIAARAQVKSQVAVMSAEGRLTAGILISLPFAIALILQFMNPGYLTPLVQSSTGNIILGVALGNMALGSLWIRKLIQLEY